MEKAQEGLWRSVKEERNIMSVVIVKDVTTVITTDGFWRTGARSSEAVKRHLAL